MKPVLIIQNDAAEDAGLLMPLLRRRGLESEVHLGWHLGVAPVIAKNYAALVILGGPQSAYETETYPYLVEEIALCRTFVATGRPVLGLCLGAQLLAVALGGQVRANSVKEIGWGEVELTAAAHDDALMHGLPSSFPAFHFHGDYFATPPDCVNLAASALTPCQLFRYPYRKGVYGFQFHVEVGGELMTSMCRNNRDYMLANGFEPERVIADGQAHIEEAAARSLAILDRWLDLVERQP